MVVFFGARLHGPHELGDLPRQSLDGVGVVLDLRYSRLAQRATRLVSSGEFWADSPDYGIKLDSDFLLEFWDDGLQDHDG